MEESVQTSRERVLALVSAQPGLHLRELPRRLGLSLRSVRYHLEGLEENALVTAHRSGPFRYEGQFDHVSMAHYDRTALPDSLTILAAGVGEHMVRVAGECADGFVGHTIASASSPSSLPSGSSACL